VRFLWLLLFWVLATPAFSASFDCSTDSLSTVEQLICQRPELSQLDTQLAKQFKSTREVMDNSVLRASQIHWMTHHQRPCGQEANTDAQVACLTKALERRLLTLSTWEALMKQPSAATEYEQLLYKHSLASACQEAYSTVDIKNCQYKTLIFLEDTMALYLVAAKQVARDTEAMYQALDSTIYSAQEVIEELTQIQKQWHSYAKNSCGFWLTANPQGTVYPVAANSCLANSYVTRLALIHTQLLADSSMALPKVF